MSRPLILAVVAATLATGGLTGCGASSGASTAGTSAPSVPAGSPSLAGQTITVYNGQHQQATAALAAAFTKQTGIKVAVRSDDEDVLAQQLATEGSASPADVFYTENTPPLVRLDERRLLAVIDPATLAAVPSQYSAQDHTWAGVSARVSALVYNTHRTTPGELPTSIEELANPKYKGKIGIAPGETDFQPIVTSIAASKGNAAALAFLKAIKANGRIESDNEALVADVNKGTVDFGLINHYYWHRLRDELGAAKINSALSYLAPQDDGYLLDVAGAAVLRSSKHQAAAQAFVAFLVSKHGEDVMSAGDTMEYPLGSGAVANAALTPLSSLHPKDFDLEQIGDGKTAVTLLQQAGLL